MAYCRECGTEIGDAKYCPGCGAAQGGVQVQVPPPPPLAPATRKKVKKKKGAGWSCGVILGLVLLLVVLIAIGGAFSGSSRGGSSPSASANPTFTPRGRPAATSKPVVVNPPVKLSGRGRQATKEFTLPSPISVAEFTHSGSSNFIVYSFSGGSKDLLINTIGRYSGSRPLVGSGKMILDIEADGSWTVNIEGLSIASTARFSGKGDGVSGMFDAPSDGAWEISHQGQSNFIVFLHCAGGSDVIANEIGSLDGSTVIQFPEGPCFWEVEADGNWSLKPR